MTLINVVMNVFIAAVPVVLGWIGWFVRRIDRRTELVEDYDRVLFRDDRVKADDGLVGSVDRLEEVVTATDGGRKSRKERAERPDMGILQFPSFRFGLVGLLRII